MLGYKLRIRILSLGAALALALTGAGPQAFAATTYTISGNVAGDAGSVAGITVSGCTTDWSFCSGGATTDEAGAFTLGGLAPGKYVLSFDTMTNPAYIYSYYKAPGTTAEYWAATPVDVTAGSATLGEIRLMTAAAIRGSLSGTAGNLSQVEIFACGSVQCAFGVVEDTGAFVIAGLVPDKYTVSFVDQSNTYERGYYNGSGLTRYASESVMVDTTGGDVTLAPIQLNTGVTITGTVVGTASGPDGIWVQVYQDDWGDYKEINPDANGNFRIGGLWPGQYRIYIEDYDQTYVSGSYTPNGLVQGREVYTNLGPADRDLGTIVLELASTTQLTVTAPGSMPTGMYAMACRTDGVCYQGAVGADGATLIKGMAAGTYTIAFHDWYGTYASGYYSDSGSLVPYPSQATLVTVPPSASGLNVTLAPANGAQVRTPDAPTNVVVVGGDAKVDVSWTAPLYDGGSQITGYWVQTDQSADSCWTTETSCTISDLTNGKTYTFQVFARNVAGMGEPSEFSDPVTPAVPVPVQVPTRLAIAASTETVTAGTPVAVTVSALDQDGAVVADYKGGVTFSSTDQAAGLPEAYTFTPADAGTHTFSVVLKTAGPQNVGVSDGKLQAGETGVTVNAGAAARFVLSGPESATAGVAQKYTVAAVDAFGNAAAFSGVVKIASTDRTYSRPSSVKLAAGFGQFTATLKTAGPQTLTLTAADGTSGQVSVQVKPAAVARLVVTANPKVLVTGGTTTVKVAAVDRYGNVATGYTGKIRFSSTDRFALLPRDFTFTAADAGVHSFTVTLKSAGVHWIKVKDTSRFRLGGFILLRVVRPARNLH